MPRSSRYSLSSVYFIVSDKLQRLDPVPCGDHKFQCAGDGSCIHISFVCGKLSLNALYIYSFKNKMEIESKRNQKKNVCQFFRRRKRLPRRFRWKSKRVPHKRYDFYRCFLYLISFESLHTLLSVCDLNQQTEKIYSKCFANVLGCLFMAAVRFSDRRKFLLYLLNEMWSRIML